MSEASTILEGAHYPTGGCVIPFLLTLDNDWKRMEKHETDPDHKNFVKTLRSSLQQGFPSFYRETAPYNALTLLDIR